MQKKAKAMRVRRDPSAWSLREGITYDVVFESGPEEEAKLQVGDRPPCPPWKSSKACSFSKDWNEFGLGRDFIKQYLCTSCKTLMAVQMGRFLLVSD